MCVFCILICILILCVSLYDITNLYDNFNISPITVFEGVKFSCSFCRLTFWSIWYQSDKRFYHGTAKFTSQQKVFAAHELCVLLKYTTNTLENHPHRLLLLVRLMEREKRNTSFSPPPLSSLQNIRLRNNKVRQEHISDTFWWKITWTCHDDTTID